MRAGAIALGLWLGWPVVGFAADARVSPATALGGYARAMYEDELVAYCKLSAPQIAAGQRIVADEKRLAEDLDEPEAAQQRVLALVAFDYEVQNHNRGGYRAWCLGEGKAAALAFLARYVDATFAPRQ